MKHTIDGQETEIHDMLSPLKLKILKIKYKIKIKPLNLGLIRKMCIT
jgi:hypothetical protein